MNIDAPPWLQPAPLPWPPMPVQTEAERKAGVRAKLKDYDYYRERFICIRPREGGERIPFKLNHAQTVLHHRIEEERKVFGMVRALIPKARRMGVSTYIGSRFFHRVATSPGRRAQVVAHRSDSAANLHREIKEFCNGLPLPLRPSVGATNAYELVFDKLKSLYKVASAEGGDIGRSDDFHDLHLSEAAFFDNTEDLSSGLLQTVQNLPGTEIVEESTGNGQSGMFYNQCMQAHQEKNKGPWRLHFLPWSLMPEYRLAEPLGWRASKEFEYYARTHGLDRQQLYWFWLQNYTIATMNGGQPEIIHRLTRQEYPAIFSECFMADSTLDFFRASLVAAAMANKPAIGGRGGLKLLCVDPAGDGQDKPWVCDRQGNAIGTRVWGELTSRDYNVQADWLVATFDRFDMDLILIDVTGNKGLLDAVRLRMRPSMQFPNRSPDKAIAVNFAYGALNDTEFGNRRAELHYKLAKWFEGDVYVPNDEMLREELAAYKWGSGACRRDEKARLFMTSKEKIKAGAKQGGIGRSPDRLDACAVSMAIEA
jgi:hypothetical protein